MSHGKTRVAVIGASGIGRHHAKWWHVEGADVCAFVGTSPASVARTSETLGGMFDFTGRGYTDLQKLLDTETPDVVDICSPNALHPRHVRCALAAGADVLCEKPFVYDDDLSAKDMQQQAAGLVEFAAQRGRILGLCSQYFVGVQRCEELLCDLRGLALITRFEGHLASPAKGRSSNPINVWIDLGPHMLAAIQALRPGGEIVQSTVKVEAAPYETTATFAVAAPGKPGLECRIRVNRTHDEPKNVRTLTLDGVEFDIQGGQGKDGQYCSRLVTPEGEIEADDFMRTLIRRTLAGQTPMTGETILTNERWLLQLAPNK